MIRLALPVLVIAIICSPALAFADDDDAVVPLAAWGAASLELSGAAYVALRFGAHAFPEDGPGALAANLAPAVVGAGAAFAAHHWGLDPTPALAAHGAFWTGVDLFVLGTLIDGRDQRDGLRVGPAAWILGAIGTIGGGVLGATVGDRAPEAWLVAPTAGAMGGALIGVLWVLLSGDISGDRSAARLTIGVVGGVTAAIATAAIVGAYTEPVEATPRVELGRGRVLASFGGTF